MAFVLLIVFISVLFICLIVGLSVMGRNHNYQHTSLREILQNNKKKK